MEPPFVLIAAIIGLLIASLAWMMVAVIWRGWTSRLSWMRTTGRIKTFGVNHDVPSVAYEYEVNGRKLTGSSIMPGMFSGGSQGTTLPKSVYLRTDGSLKFPPNAEVGVFFNPKNPSDAALVTGVPANIWKGFALLLTIGGLAGAVYEYRAWAEEHAAELIAAGFVCFGVFLFCCSLKWIKDWMRSRRFPSTGGRLLKADVVYSSGSGDGVGGYEPAVEFEYEVNGVLYQSRQMTFVPVQMLRSRPKDVRTMIERLRTGSETKVYYDPQAPWIGFLQHGSAWSAMVPVFLGLIFDCVGLAMWFRFLKH